MAPFSTAKRTTFYTQSGTDKAIAAAIAGIKLPDLSGYATKTDLASGLSTKAEIAALAAVKAVADAALPKDEAASKYATASALQAVRKTAEDAAAVSGSLDMSGFLKKDDAAATYQVRGSYALKSDVPDVSGLAKKSDVASAYQLKGDYVTRGDVDSKVAEATQGVVKTGDLDAALATKADKSALDGKADVSALSAYQPKGSYALKSDVPDVSGLATRDDVVSGLAGKADRTDVPDVSGYETSEHAASTYQPKGEYALASDLETKADASALATKANASSLAAVKSTADAALSKDEAVSTYATLASVEAVKETAGAALSKSDAASTYAKASELAAVKKTADAAAPASDIPDVSGLISKTDADKAYQVKGDYATHADVTQAVADAATSGTVNLSGYATTGDLDAVKAVADDALTRAEADKVYQPKGDYATASSVSDALNSKADVSAIPDVSRFVTQSDADTKYQVKGSYATTSDLSLKADASALDSYETAAHAAEAYQPKGSYALKADVPDVSGFATTAALTEGLAGKADATALAAVKKTADAALPADTAASTYATSSALSKGLAGKVDSTALASYETKAHAAETYQPKGEYLTARDLPEAPDLSPFAKTADVAVTYATKKSVPDVSGLAKAADVAAAYQPKGDYATHADLTEKLAGKADKADIPSLTGYAKTSAVDALDARVGALEAAPAATGRVLVLGPTDEVPAGTPSDTVIVRRSA